VVGFLSLLALLSFGAEGLYILLYVCVLATCVGIGFLMIAAKGATTSWTILLIATGVGAVLASQAPTAIPLRWPDCMTCRPPTIHSALWEFVHTYPTLTIALAVLSVLLVPVGWVLQNRQRASSLAWVLQRLPLILIVVIGLAALILFPNPYYGGTM
jgi:hypothetical protein